LFTHRPVTSAVEAQPVYRDWRFRPNIEHLYRFIQEDGPDVEAIRVQTLERQRRQMIERLWYNFLVHAKWRLIIARRAYAAPALHLTKGRQKSAVLVGFPSV